MNSDFILKLLDKNNKIIKYDKSDLKLIFENQISDIKIKYKEKGIIILINEKDTLLVIASIVNLFNSNFYYCITRDLDNTFERISKIIKIENISKLNNFYLLEINKEIINEGLNFNGGFIFETSGTTGEPKYVIQSKENLLQTGKDICDICKLNKTVVETIYSPLGSAFFIGRIIALYLKKGTVILNSDYKFINFVQILSKYKINSVSADTAIWTLILKDIIPSIDDISKKIKWIKLSSANPEQQIKVDLINLFPKTRIVLGYGLSEYMRASFQILSKDTLKKINKINSIGFESNNTEVVVMNNSSGIISKYGHGEILVRGGHLAISYLGNQFLWNSKIKKGYFCTGDQGQIDGEGYIFIFGRIDNIYPIGNKNYSVEWLEKEFGSLIKRKFKEIEISIVIEKRNDAYQNQINICLTKSIDTLIEKKLIENISKEFNFPKIIIKFKIIPNIPKTKNGKVIREKLYKLYLESNL